MAGVVVLDASVKAPASRVESVCLNHGLYTMPTMPSNQHLTRFVQFVGGQAYWVRAGAQCPPPLQSPPFPVDSEWALILGR